MHQDSRSWTDQSVREFAKGDDPVAAITSRAREIAVEAIDAGWTGPPFDPFELADHLKLETAPRHDIQDARTVPVGKSRYRIEYNPNRSTGRIRFSVAHEIAHTLFPDCAEQVRNRAASVAEAGDDWQLEALCNLAAAEFLMPIGSFGRLANEELDINQLKRLQSIFEVSLEALLIRTVRLTKRSCAAFTAYPITGEEDRRRYRLGYMVCSQSWTWNLPQGFELPSNSVVRQCSAIGYTAKGDEEWLGEGNVWRVECCGLPPFPGTKVPRVAGFLIDSDGEESEKELTYLIGDATEPRSIPALILQVVNDQTPNWGGNGFAVAIRSVWPDVQDAFRNWVDDDPNRLSLGHVHFARAADDVWVASMVAQKGYGPSDRPRIRYGALRRCLGKAADFASEGDMDVHLPRIGCGEGRGSWDIIEELVQLEFRERNLKATVYDLPGSDPPESPQRSLELV